MSDFEFFGLKSGIWQGILCCDMLLGCVLLVYMGSCVVDVWVMVQDDGSYCIVVVIFLDKLLDGVQIFILLEDGGQDNV